MADLKFGNIYLNQVLHLNVKAFSIAVRSIKLSVKK